MGNIDDDDTRDDGQVYSQYHGDWITPELYVGNYSADSDTCLCAGCTGIGRRIPSLCARLNYLEVTR